MKSKGAILGTLKEYYLDLDDKTNNGVLFVSEDSRIKEFQDMNLMDDFLFSIVMKYTSVTKGMLERILDKKILKIKSSESQAEQKTTPDLHGVRLDLLVEDSLGNVYDVEVQIANRHDVQKRSRYYNALIDYNKMLLGDKDYKNLPEVYIIFICSFDMFGKGLYRYTFNRFCHEDKNIMFEDKVQILILNTNGYVKDGVSKELVSLLEYMKNTTVEYANETKDELLLELQRKVNEVKKDPKVRWNYMTIGHKISEAREDALKEGIEKGIEEGNEGTERVFRVLLRNPKATNVEITALTGATDERINRIREIINQSQA